MSRAYDAKQSVLKAYPANIPAGIALFYTIMDCGPSDFRYENKVGAGEYCYGEAGRADDAEYEEA